MKNTSLILCLTGFFTFFGTNVFSQDNYFFNSNKLTTIPDTEVTCGNSNNFRTCRYAEPSIRTLPKNTPTIEITFTQYAYSIPSAQALEAFTKDQIKNGPANNVTFFRYTDSFKKTYTSVNFDWKTGRIFVTLCEGDTTNLDLSNELEEYSLSTSFSGEGVNSRLFRVSEPGAYIVVASRMFFDGLASVNLLINVTTPEPIEISAGDAIGNVCFYPEETNNPSAREKIEISNTGESPAGGTWDLLLNSKSIELNDTNGKVYLDPTNFSPDDYTVYTLRYSAENYEGCTYLDEKNLLVSFFPENFYENLKLVANSKEVFFSELFEVQVASIDPGFTLESGAFSKYSWDLDDGITLNNCEIPRRIYSREGLKTINFTGTLENGCVHTINGKDFLHVAGVKFSDRLSAAELELLRSHGE